MPEDKHCNTQNVRFVYVSQTAKQKTVEVTMTKGDFKFDMNTIKVRFPNKDLIESLVTVFQVVAWSA